ncbi:MAG: TRAP transporter substrate-binding protein [Lachnospiraceae bacterium]|nr:TRAP transporter substrate-binding protein [Lachnospiraceae bacterium]
MKKLIAFVLAVGLVLSLAACGGQTNGTTKGADADTTKSADTDTTAASQQAEHTYQLGVAQEDSNPYSQGAYYFEKLVEEKSNGRIQIEVITAGALGGEEDMTEGVSIGTHDMCLTSNAPLAVFDERFSLFDLPFIFTSIDQVDVVLDGEIGRGLLDGLESSGIKGLSYFENGFRNITSNKPINSIDDIKGMKLRTMSNPSHVQYWKDAGANPTPMTWGEVYTALQQGTIDGQENPLLAIKGNKIYEVNKYIAMTQHVYTPVELIMNLNKFNELSADDQKLLLDCAQEAAVYERGIAREINVDVKFFTDMGITVTYPDVAPFQAAAANVWKEYGANVQDLIEQIQALNNK